MAGIPRIITVDPTGVIARIVRSAVDLLDLSVIQIDVPTGYGALDELDKVNLVVTAFEPDENMKGWEFALKVKQKSPDTSVIIVAGEDDPALDEETLAESPFVYLTRPIDTHQFLRVLVGGLESHEKMVEAMTVSDGGAPVVAAADMGPIPLVDLNATTGIVDSLLQDLGAMAIIFASRAGETLLERGAPGYIDRDRLTMALMPVMMTNIGVRDLVGGQVSTVQLYDGDDFDVYVLSVGLHHFMCVMFDGETGSRQFGAVSRYGRRAVEDLLAVLGPNAFQIQAPVPVAPPKPKLKKEAELVEEEEHIPLAPAFETDEHEAVEEEPEFQLEALSDAEFDPDKLFGGDFAVSDDIFDLEKMEELAKETAQGGTGEVDWDKAVELGLLPKT